LCAARDKWVCVRMGMIMPLSASSHVLGMCRARARAVSTAGLVGWLGLGGADGGACGLMARELALASPLHLSPTGGFWSRRREWERAR
jgi:hypothetical protein